MVRRVYRSNTLLSRLAYDASFFALGVIALGALTRLMDAGLGCPDWPGCYGHLTAPLTASTQQTYKAWAEMIHRYFVLGLSLFILSIIFIIFSKKSCRLLVNMLLACGLIILLVYQIILGQLTVTLKLLPIIVTQHLLGGFLILALLWLLYLYNNSKLNNKLPAIRVQSILPWAFIAILFLLVQIFLGAWTSTNYASLSCADFPMCMNEQAIVWHFKEAFNLVSPVGVNYEGGVLSETIRQTIQMTHRIGAVIVTLYLLMLSVIVSIKFNKTIEIMKSVYVLLGLLCIQLCLGMANVVLKLPLVVAVLHNLVAVLLLLAAITLTYKLVIMQRKVVAE